MKGNYPIIIRKSDVDGYEVEIPDLAQFTEGDTIEECILNAKSCANITVCTMEDEKMEIPTASDMEDLQKNQDSSECLVFALIEVDSELYRKNVLNKSMKVTVTIPTYLNIKADEYNINKSKVLQEALKAEISKKCAVVVS